MAWRISPRIAAKLLYALYRPWCATLQLHQTGRECFDHFFATRQPLVLALWHSECFPLIWLKTHLPLMTIASQSRDGEYIAGVLEQLGFEVVRGSSSRGGVRALLSCVRLMHERALVPAITVDGPRGPRHEVKDGAIFLAQRAGVPIMPVRAFSERCIRFKSWDRFELPLPLSRVRIVFGEPYYIECDKLDDEVLARERVKLRQRLNDMEQV